MVHVITPNGSHCIYISRMLERKFSKIRWLSCASHSHSWVMLENMGRFDRVDRIFSVSRSMVKFVTKRSKVLSIYRAYSELLTLKLVTTGFAFLFIIVERLLRGRESAKVRRWKGYTVVANVYSCA